jgi:crotonobetainyl-CoA:carnitine CoA-transferase CaiB-like acyl-CoA transferase
MRPLRGVRVLDLSRLIPGPFATLVLADLGATVDKIEDPGGGDYLRLVPPQIGDASVGFHALNRGKRSAVLDLKKPAAREAFRRLARSYDVLFEQFRPGVLARLGLGHDELRADNPRLVVCALTGYGQTGELAQRAGHDLDYLARAGLLGLMGPAGGPPQVPAFQLADVSGGLWCVVAIQAALAERERTGRGSVLDIAMTDGVLGFASMAIAGTLAGAPPARGDDTLTGGIAPYNTYLSKDGRPIALASLEPKFWAAFCAGVGLEPDMTALVPGPHQAELKRRVADVVGSRTADEWAAFAAEHDCCLEAAIEPAAIRRDPHLASRGLWLEAPSPAGPIPQFRTPVTPRDLEPTPAPRGGEHTRVILREAGFSDAEVDELVRSGAARE